MLALCLGVCYSQFLPGSITMVQNTALAGHLSGWKEIAAYLRVSVRTAQSLERDQGLPVRRSAGAKGHVFAFSSEVDEWRQRPQKSGPDSVLPVLAPHSDRRQWLRLALGGVATLAAGAGFGYGIPKFHFGDRGPATYRVEGDELIVGDKDNSELWRHPFGQQLYEPAYEPARVETGVDPCQFADLDGDGNLETVFRLVPKVTGEEVSINCFDYKGRLRWKFVPGKTVIDDQGRSFAPPYWANSFQIVGSKGSRAKQVVVSSHHNWSFPTQVAVLDGSAGRLVSEYWHRGHLLHMAKADLSGDGNQKIILGGVNDAPEYKRATLVMFEPDNINGCSRNPRGGVYFKGMKPGTEKNEVYFPKTPFGQRAEFNIVAAVRAVDGRILVGVTESTLQRDPSVVIYELDYHLQPVTVALGDSLMEHYQQAWNAGTLPRESFTAITERLKAGIVVV